MFGTKKLLPADLLPLSLWDNQDGILNLPPILQKAYLTVLRNNGLDSLASERDPKARPIGGISKEDTDKHFAQAFDGSVARVQLAILDPNDEILDAAEALVNTLTGNRLVIVDAPCGAGAASLSLLSTIAELRKKNIVPRIPLEVQVFGAEIAEPARNYANQLFQEAADDLRKEAIFLNYELCRWDATSKHSTTELIKKIISTQNDRSR
ncbi:MAG: hypothetical protein KKG00_15300, partial [Bacteroidetes bacterium]|nr:hypothetical protein [Bacteroidota bacterium]